MNLSDQSAWNPKVVSLVEEWLKLNITPFDEYQTSQHLSSDSFFITQQLFALHGKMWADCGDCYHFFWNSLRNHVDKKSVTSITQENHNEFYCRFLLNLWSMLRKRNFGRHSPFLCEVFSPVSKHSQFCTFWPFFSGDFRRWIVRKIDIKMIRLRW